MACVSCGDKPKKCGNCNKNFPRTVVEIDNPEQITLMRKVTIPASMGDDTTVPPAVGKYKNVLLNYEANNKTYLYSSDGIPTQLNNGVTDYEAAVNLPQINGHTLLGNKTAEQLGLQDKLTAGEGVSIDANNVLDVNISDGLKLDDNNSIYAIKHVFDTVADMKESTDLVNGDYAQTLGFHALNDGGGAIYKIRSTGTANEMDIISLSSNSLNATLIIKNELNVKQLGAYGDGMHDESVCINRALSLSPIVFIPGGIFIVNSSINLGARKIYGAGQFRTFIMPSEDLSGPVIKIISNFAEIDNLCLSSDNYDYEVPGTSNTQTAIDIISFHYANITNTRIVGFNMGVYCARAWILNFSNDVFICCNNGIYGIKEFNSVMVEKCLFNTNLCGLYIDQGFSTDIEGCSFEGNTKGAVVRNLSDATFDGCYFEGNTECSVHVVWGTHSTRNVKIANSSFYCGSSVQTLVKYHMVQNGYLVLENCVMRNNTSLPAGTTPIFTRTNDSLVRPHLIGCDIGASYTLGVNCYVDTLAPTLIASSDWFEPASGVSIVSDSIYEDNKHIYGTVVFKFDTAPTSTQQSIGTFKTDYIPHNAMNTFGALSDGEYTQSTNNLCYVHMDSAGIAIGNGDSSSTYVKLNLNYVRR